MYIYNSPPLTKPNSPIFEPVPVDKSLRVSPVVKTIKPLPVAPTEPVGPSGPVGPTAPVEPVVPSVPFVPCCPFILKVTIQIEPLVKEPFVTMEPPLAEYVPLLLFTTLLTPIDI
jgi:hypothetical protein